MDVWLIIYFENNSYLFLKWKKLCKNWDLLHKAKLINATYKEYPVKHL